MKVEVDISDDMHDEIILASLKEHLDLERNYNPPTDEEKEINKDIIIAFEVLIDYYGG